MHYFCVEHYYKRGIILKKMKSMHVYLRMLGFLKPYIPLLIVSIFLSFLIAAFDGMSYWFIGTLPQILFSPETVVPEKPDLITLNSLNDYFKYVTHQFLVSQAWANPLLILCILAAVTFTLRNIVFYIHKLLISLLNLKIVKKIRNQLYHHVLLLPISYYDRNKSGSIISLIVNDINQINVSLSNVILSLITQPIRLIFSISILFIINARLTLTIFLLYPVLSYIIITIGKSVKRRSRREFDSFEGLISILTETINGVRAVKMFNTNEHESKKFQAENAGFVRRSFRSERMRSLVRPLNESLSMNFIVLLIWYGGRKTQLAPESFDPEDFMHFLVYLVLSYQPFKELTGVNNAIQSGIAAAERVFRLFDMQPEKLHGSRAHKQKTAVFENEICFDHVFFRYPGCDENVLTDVNFCAKKGNIIAIVGSSGSGKSTILDLLPRFYEIHKGRVTFDGVDYREFNLYSLRDLFGIVSQETILFNDSIRNNIAYGKQDASFEKIQEAAAAANILEFVEELENGFDTIIGERGVTLSGGQRQRISIARALLKNPQILILDEATSALDTESERLVQDAIDNLVKSRTCFVVAHRLSTVCHANKILVLENGTIVEQGNHEELMTLNKLYRYFYDIQFSKKRVRKNIK